MCRRTPARFSRPCAFWFVVSTAFTLKAGLAQVEVPPDPAPVPQLAPMLGGNLPVPDQPITITWDPRFRPEQTRAALVGDYYIIEGDMIIGTVDEVRQATRNSLASRARSLLELDDLEGAIELLDLTEGQREAVAQAIRGLAEQPVEESRISAVAPVADDLTRLLGDALQFRASTPAQRPDQSQKYNLTDPAGDALDKLSDELPRQDSPTVTQRGLVAPRPPEDQQQVPILRAIAIEGFRWPGGVVPYFIDPSYEPFRASFERACDLWEIRTDAVSFRPYRTGDPDYLFVQLVSGDAGSSFVGRIPGGQFMNLLHPSVFPESHIAHELGHALGLFHEQSRPDRSSFITLIEQNIQDGWLSQFETPVQAFTTLGTGFDFFSIMLYDTRAGSLSSFNNQFPVYRIRPEWVNWYHDNFTERNGQPYRLDTSRIGLGNVRVPSRTDIQAINARYGGQLAPAMAPAEEPGTGRSLPPAPELAVAPVPGPPFPSSRPSPLPPSMPRAAAAPVAAPVAVSAVPFPSSTTIKIEISVPGAAPSIGVTTLPTVGVSQPLTNPIPFLPAGVVLPAAPPDSAEEDLPQAPTRGGAAPPHAEDAPGDEGQPGDEPQVDGSR
jgi:hypothetical protein